MLTLILGAARQTAGRLFYEMGGKIREESFPTGYRIGSLHPAAPKILSQMKKCARLVFLVTNTMHKICLKLFFLHR